MANLVIMMAYTILAYLAFGLGFRFRLNLRLSLGLKVGSGIGVRLLSGYLAITLVQNFVLPPLTNHHAFLMLGI